MKDFLYKEITTKNITKIIFSMPSKKFAEIGAVNVLIKVGSESIVTTLFEKDLKLLYNVIKSILSVIKENRS